MVITLANNYISASVNNMGAELFSLKTKQAEYMWEGNPEFWGKHSPVLFPIIGALRNDTYRYEGKEYILPRHGFARDKSFNVVKHTENSAVFLLSSDSETRKVYPFDFELCIIYTLQQKSLTINYEVISKSSKIMPFSLGAHPAFALPGNFDSYSLDFNEDNTLIACQLDNNLLSARVKELSLRNNKLPLNYNLFTDDALVIKNIASKEITIAKNAVQVLKVSYSDFPDLGIWTKPGAPFICIEPWHGYADSIDSTGNIMNKQGIIKLPAGKTFTTAFTIKILQ